MNSCKYTWIIVRIPLTTCEMKSISIVITMSLLLLKYKYIYISMYIKYNYMYMCESIFIVWSE